MFTKTCGTEATTTASAPGPAWSTLAEAAAVVATSANFRRTVSVALVVGTVFFSMNQLPEVLAGEVTSGVVLKAILTYIVPLLVSNYGVLAATRRRSVHPNDA